MLHGHSQRYMKKRWSEGLFLQACRLVAQGISREEHGSNLSTASIQAGESPCLISRMTRLTSITTDGIPPALPNSPSSSRTNAPQPTVDPIADQHNRLQPIDHAFATFRAGIVEQLNATQEEGRRQSAVLETQVKDLETGIEDVKAERQQLHHELVEAKSEVEKWKAQYEGLRKAMLDNMDRRF